ncbi:MAG: DUF2007 domain-containing protein [Psychrobium sp.]|nr:DUF2007 domain-containing protein [Psychrobium sp.]
MKLVYSNESLMSVNNAKALVEAQDIATFIKNEFASGAIGEVSAIDSWPELWVFDDSQSAQASEILNALNSNQDTVEWQCEQCDEHNDASFEICWNCQTDKIS